VVEVLQRDLLVCVDDVDVRCLIVIGSCGGDIGA
jgi:hypothetical protein